MTNDLDQHAPAYETSFKHHDENLAMLRAYAELLVSGLRRSRAARILGFGVGHEVVVRRIAEYAQENDAVYTVLEGSQAIIDRLLASGGAVCSANVRIEHTYFESYVPSAPFDAIEMGFVLEHVSDPNALLAQHKSALTDRGTLYVAVPNARSLHRLLGHAAGFLPDVFQLSAQDHELGHRRYFDFDTLVALLTEQGFCVSNERGLYLKPFTTDQLSRLNLPPQVFDALVEVGLDMPRVANGIYVECRRRDLPA